MPNVDSIILKITFNKEISKDNEFNKTFVNIVKASFALRRKTILNNLTTYFKNKEKAQEILQKANIEILTRPEQITLEQYLKLASVVYENSSK